MRRSLMSQKSNENRKSKKKDKEEEEKSPRPTFDTGVEEFDYISENIYN